MVTKKKIAAGIVTYNPDISRLEQNVFAILPQVEFLMIVDNGSSNFLEVCTLCNEYEKIKLIGNKCNKGIAYALNQIFNTSVENGYEYTLTLDQDSISPDNLIKELSTYVNETTAIVCPFIRDINRMDEKKPSEYSTFIERCITSGSLTLNKAWENIDGFDEEMFIDGVDLDFCDRLGQYGYKIIRANNIELTHEIGRRQIKRFLGKSIEVWNHSAFRKYYIAKNIVYLDRKNKSESYPVKTYLRVIKQMLLVLFFENDKKNKLVQLTKGAKDGARCNINNKLNVNGVRG